MARSSPSHSLHQRTQTWNDAAIGRFRNKRADIRNLRSGLPRKKEIIMNKPSPVPPDNRTPKGTGTDPKPDTGSHAKGTKNPDQQDQSANTKQNATHQGYQQDR
jgi:hypothetical protein